MKKLIFLALFLIGIGGLFFYFLNGKTADSLVKTPTSADQSNTPAIRYIPIGDSYTIGLGVDEKDRWPNLLVENLKKEGINIELVANPAVSGYTVDDAIEHELPVVEREKPDFVTVFIGANDSFRLRDTQEFRKDLSNLLDRLQKVVSSQNVVLITLPDYTKSAASREYSAYSKNYLNNINGYNQIIKDEAGKRGMKVADLYPVSVSMTDDKYYISDGLHPSALGYQAWEKAIFPVVLNVLTGN